MNELDEYQKFKKFLSSFHIRRLKGKLDANDFDEEKYEYIRPHLETLLPSLSLTEVLRVQKYFNDLLDFEIKGILGKSVLPSMPSSPIPAFDEQAANALGTQTQSSEISGLSSQINAQEETPIDTQAQMQRRTVPLMQSTPLSVPMHFGEESGALAEQQKENEIDFIAEVISQINLSPIPQVSAHQPVLIAENSKVRAGTSLAQDIESTAVPVQKGVKRRRIAEQNTKQKTFHSPLITEPPTRQPKKVRKKMNFNALCSLSYKQRTEEEIKKAQDSFLHFQQLPGKTRNMIKRIIKNVVILEGERGHIPKQRITNLSNIIRAHASQGQSSVEQPNQISFPNVTPQALLRTSHLQPFMPLRADTSSPLQSIEIDRISSIPPMRSILRQQPLLTIPERDSSILIPFTPPTEEIPLNNSSIRLPPLQEQVSDIPTDVYGDPALLLNLPMAVPEDFEMIDERREIINPLVQQNTCGSPMAASSRAAPENVEITGGQPNTSKAATTTNDAVPLRLDELEPLVELIPQRSVHNEEIANFCWFDILRPRGELVYPREGGNRRKRRRARVSEKDDRNVRPRRAYELPEIPVSPQRVDFPNISVDFSQQITQEPVLAESEFNGYFDLLKEAITNPECRRCERFDPRLFSESDDFEMYTYIFKRVIKDDYVPMDTLHKKGTTRLEAAKGFKLILELKTMDLIEIDAIDTRIMGFKFKTDNDLHTL